MIVYKLDRSIAAEKIIADINKLIQENRENIQNKLLILEIRNITTEDTSHVLKLEYKKEEK